MQSQGTDILDFHNSDGTKHKRTLVEFEEETPHEMIQENELPENIFCEKEYHGKDVTKSRKRKRISSGDANKKIKLY